MTTSSSGNAEPKKLADKHPHELAFFKKVFLWDGSHKGCYTRRFYERKDINGLIIQKWQPLKTKGNNQPLYTSLVDSLAEKHLNFENFIRSREDGDRLAPDMWESAFWVGTMAGPRTRTHAIDIDLHDRIGWYSVPTRWHSSRTGSVDGPYSERDIPVVRPSLKFYMTAKAVYDAFPDRIWAFSSASLGFAVWQIFEQPELTHVVHRKAAAKLSATGLLHIEHYPLPPSPTAELGRCYRRPCGMDSGLITPTGLIVDPIQQIRWFMQPHGTPSFAQIVREHSMALMRSYRAFLTSGEAPDHTRLTKQEKVRLVRECWDVVEEVKDWVRRGCLVDPSVVRQQDEKQEKKPELYTHIINSTVGEEENKKEGHLLQSAPFPDSFWRADLPSIVESGQWLPFVKFLVENGFPVEDKFYDIVSTLAKWFLYVEFYGLAAQILSDAGSSRNLLEHPTRLSEHRLEASHSEVSNKSKWEYVPDDTPLPDFAVERIRREFERAGRQIRKRNGEFPVINAVTRFFNFLLSGRKPGQRRCGRELLIKMGFNSRGKDRDAVISLLVASGLVIKGDYRPKTRSTLWILADADRYLVNQQQRQSGLGK